MRILILTASTGGGHKRAAAALKDTIEKNSPNTVVNVTDGIEYCGRFYNRLICNGYLVLATKTPKIYGKVYNISDNDTKLNALCNQINSREGRKLISLFITFKPDVVISCHPFVTTMLGRLKKDNFIDLPVISLITDFEVHRTYISPYIDSYITSNYEMVREIKKLKISDSCKVLPYGIPIFDKFYNSLDKHSFASVIGFDQSKPTLLLMAGSFGVTSVLKFYTALMETQMDCQCIVITGRNKKLYDAFEKYLADKTKPQKKTKLLYFVDNVEDYMHYADLIITKPGGLTVTESLACKLPMAIYSAFPGQEKENADFLEKHNVAITLNKNPKLGATQIVNLINSPQELKAMKNCCENVCIRNSAYNILKLAEDLCKENYERGRKWEN